MLKGPLTRTSLVLCSLTMHDLHNRQSASMRGRNHLLYFARFHARPTPKYPTALPGFLTIPSINIW